MKKISNVEVKLINLNASDVIATSQLGLYSTPVENASEFQIGARGYYDDEEDLW